MNTSRISGLILLSLILAPSAIPQGSLTPPGAPAPTMKALDQLEPRTPIDATTASGDATSVFKITQPGSYYLTSNVAGVSGKHGIYITTGNVTVDLMGFELVGVGGSLDGIHADNAVASINYAVRNGTVRNWGANGLNLNVQGRHRISDLRALNNGTAGIFCANRGVIEGCVVSGNGAQGIFATSDIVSNCAAGTNGGVGILAATVTACSSSGNTGDGIQASAGSVTHCITSVNGGAGIVGAFGTVITGCSTIANTGNGITLDEGSMAVDCYVRGNHAVGISATEGSRIAGCTSRDNDGAGIATGDSCAIENCVAFSNGLPASIPGIQVGATCKITGCASRENTGIGIQAGNSATLADCTAEGNQGTFGIAVGSESAVSNCVALANTNNGASSGGFSIGASSHITNCISSNNTTTAGTPTASTGTGITGSFGCAIRHCVVRTNKGDGIRVTSDSRIEGNTADGNGAATGDGAGIHVTSSDCRVEGNNLTDNDRGLDVDSSGNLIIRNSASGNASNYEIAANNSVGAIVVPAASVVISGNGAFASSLGRS